MPDFLTPTTSEPDLYQNELIRLGHSSWVKPLTIWFNNRLPIAWMLVCQNCDPRVQLFNALEHVKKLEEWQLLEALIALEINKTQLRFGAGTFEPTIETFEQFVWRTGEVVQLERITPQHKAVIQRSFIDAFSAARLFQAQAA